MKRPNSIRCSTAVWMTACLFCCSAAGQQRPRARELGIRIGVLSPGPTNTIVDVAGVQVGHRTLHEGDDLRTGVTVVIPHGGNVFQQKLPAALYVANGFGKFVGATQIQELGVIETPIVLTNTLSTFAAADALVKWTLNQPGNEEVRSVNPVVGECNDGFLNDIRRQQVTSEDVFAAIASAADEVQEGSVGAGTGTSCLGWKGGIGSSSRTLPAPLGGFTVGVLVQTNFGGVLNVAGAPVGQQLGRYYLQQFADPAAQQRPAPEEGSCIVIVATDAPLDARQLGRLARRATLGLAAVGSPLAHGSGDYILAFSADPRLRSAYQDAAVQTSRPVLREESLSPMFQAVREATEEAVLNSMFRATTVVGVDGHRMEAIPIDRVKQICRQYGAIPQ